MTHFHRSKCTFSSISIWWPSREDWSPRNLALLDNKLPMAETEEENLEEGSEGFEEGSEGSEGSEEGGEVVSVVDG